jgi:hypothetical protein
MNLQRRGESVMKLQEIKQIAKGMGISVSTGRSKEEVIRVIQTAEGNSPCYKTFSDCGIMDCLWRGDCQSKKK